MSITLTNAVFAGKLHNALIDELQQLRSMSQVAPNTLYREAHNLR